MGRRWEADGEQVQLGVQMAHVNCATTEPALADCPSLGSARGTFSSPPQGPEHWRWLSAPTPHTRKGVNRGLRPR